MNATWSRYNIILFETDILLRLFRFSRQHCARNRNPLSPPWAVTTAIRLRKSERMVAAVTLDALDFFSKRTQNVSHYRDGFAKSAQRSRMQSFSRMKFRGRYVDFASTLATPTLIVPGRIYVFGIACWIADLRRIRRRTYI